MEEARRKEDEARRNAEADAEARRREERRIAALEESRRAEEKRTEEERLRLAAIPDDDKRAEFVRKVQEVLKRSRCYEGAVNGSSTDAQGGLDKFVANAVKKGSAKPARIELAKASVGDFESWLKDADAVKDGLCVVPNPVSIEKPRPVAKAKIEKAEPGQQEKAQRAPAEKSAVRDVEACLNQCHASGGNVFIQNRCNRRCRGS